MNLEMIGLFLASLRKERGLTQEALGEQIGVTNKTVSRWEKGNYLPPAEMLKALSEFYGVSINEILSGRRLEAQEYRPKAEENIRSAMENSPFTIGERLNYYKKKWRRDHLGGTLAVCCALLGVYVVGLMNQRGWSALVLLGMFFWLICRRNEMMIYVENHVYGAEERTEASRPGERLYRYIRILMPAALAVSVLILVDLGDNLLYSMIPELNDGLTIRGDFSLLLFGDDGWSREEYFHGFSRVLRITGWLLAGNLGLVCVERKKK